MLYRIDKMGIFYAACLLGDMQLFYANTETGAAAYQSGSRGKCKNGGIIMKKTLQTGMNRTAAVILAAALTMSMAGCGNTGAASSAPAETVAPVSSSSAASGASTAAAQTGSSSEASSAKPSKDRSGNDITVPDTINAIVSMSPAETEMLDDLGLIDKVVACDTYSPQYVKDLPKDVVQFDMMSPDAEKIVSLKPDIVFTSGMSSSDGSDAFASVKKAGVCVADIPSSSSISGIQDDIRFVAACVGKADDGEKVVSDMQAQIDKIAAIGKTISDDKKKTVLFEISGSPSIYSVGKDTYIDEMINLIGAKNVTGDQESWISVTDENAIKADPDVILTGSNAEKDPAASILALKGWENVSAVKNKEVYYIDNASVMMPSEDIVEALKEMAVAVYPDEYSSIADEIKK